MDESVDRKKGLFVGDLLSDLLSTPSPATCVHDAPFGSPTHRRRTRGSSIRQEYQPGGCRCPGGPPGRDGDSGTLGHKTLYPTVMVPLGLTEVVWK